MKNKIISGILCICMLLSTLSITALAGVDEYEAYINGEEFESDNLSIECGGGTGDYKTDCASAFSDISLIVNPAASSWTEVGEEAEDGVDYEWNGSTMTIITAKGLAKLANIVNGTGGEPKDSFAGKTALLANDIDLDCGLVRGYDADITNDTAFAEITTENSWIPIGGDGHNFAGTFDGQEFSVKGIKINTSANYQSLFGMMQSGAAVKNVNVIDSRICCGNFVGGVVGYNIGTIANCYNTGSVSGVDFVGGVAGYNAGSGTVTNCYNTGSVSGSGNGVGGVAGNNIAGGTITNCYCKDDIAAVGTGSSDGAAVLPDNKMKAASGEGDALVDKLNGYIDTLAETNRTLAETLFTWENGTDGYPVHTGETWLPETWTAVGKEAESGIDFEWSDSDGNGTEDTMTIKTAKGLAKLANIVNGTGGETKDNFAGKTIDLTADIDLSAHLWTPIGTASNPFSGSFNGKGKTISGMSIAAFGGSSELYIGLFGQTQYDVIENLNISGTIYAASNNDVFVGGIVGMAYGTDIINCHSGVNINAISADDDSDCMVGGIVGGAVGASDNVITGCSNSGNICGNGENEGVLVEAGGITGLSGDIEIRNCYNTGKVSSVFGGDEHSVESMLLAGGITGGISSNIYGVSNIPAFIYNCYNRGEIEALGGTPADRIHKGGVFGININEVTVANCYSASDDCEYIDETGAVTNKSENEIKALVPILNAWVQAQNFLAGNELYETWRVTDLNDGFPAFGQLFTLTVNDSTAISSGAGEYEAGAVVTIDAGVKSGYSFIGWTADSTEVVFANANSTVTTFVMPESDISITANRKKISSGGSGGTSYYTVKFETNGGSAIKSHSVKRNGAISSVSEPTKDGYVFAGWYTDKALTKEFDPEAKIIASLTLYAKWTEIPVDNSKNEIILTIGKKEASVFGVTKSNDVAPEIVSGRTMLPARFVAEELGAKVEWDETAPGIVTITKDDITIVIRIGEEYATINGEQVKLDSPAFIENDRTYTPQRFIAEALGATVDWIEAEQKVIVTRK